METSTTRSPLLQGRFYLYFFSMVAGWPAVFVFMGWLPDSKISYVALCAIALISAMVAGGNKIPQAISIILSIQLVSFALYFVLFQDASYLTRCLYLVITYAFLSIQVKYASTDYVDTNVLWLTIQAALASIGFVLTIAGLLPVISTFMEFDGHTGSFYGLFTTNATYDGMIRVAGFFDEPGAFAFWGIVALLFNKLFINNKYIEVILIIGLFTTLSMAYLIQLAFYLLLFYKDKLSKFLFFVFVVLILIYIISSLSPEFYDAILGRFQFDQETGSLRGDNRSDLAASSLAIWKTSPIFGVGAKNAIEISKSVGFIGANPYTFFATDGLLGQIVLWLPLFYLFHLRKYRREYGYAAIILFLGFMQRPYDPTQLLYVLSVYMLIFEAYRNIHIYPESIRSRLHIN